MTMSRALPTILCTSIFLMSCTPQLKIVEGQKIEPAPGSLKEVSVLGINEPVPEGARFIDNIQTSGNFFSKMDIRVNESVNILKAGADQLNGNIIVIQDIAFPGPFKSKSYDIRAQVYISEVAPRKNFVLAKSISAEKNYIMLFRDKRTFGSGLSFPVYLNDQFVGGLDNGRKYCIELDKDIGDIDLEIESYGELYKIPILFKGSSVIYIDCGINKDGSPNVQFPEELDGKKQYEKVKYAP